MTKTEAALERLEAALGRLEIAAEAAEAKQDSDEARPELPFPSEERDRLEGEIRSLRERAKEDARLRAEAADAVRDALSDLRTIVAQRNGQGAAANA